MHAIQKQLWVQLHAIVAAVLGDSFLSNSCTFPCYIRTWQILEWEVFVHSHTLEC